MIVLHLDGMHSLTPQFIQSETTIFNDVSILHFEFTVLFYHKKMYLQSAHETH